MNAPRTWSTFMTRSRSRSTPSSGLSFLWFSPTTQGFDTSFVGTQNCSPVFEATKDVQIKWQVVSGSLPSGVQIRLKIGTGAFTRLDPNTASSLIKAGTTFVLGVSCGGASTGSLTIQLQNHTDNSEVCSNQLTIDIVTE